MGQKLLGYSIQAIGMAEIVYGVNNSNDSYERLAFLLGATLFAGGGFLNSMIERRYTSTSKRAKDLEETAKS